MGDIARGAPLRGRLNNQPKTFKETAYTLGPLELAGVRGSRTHPPRTRGAKELKSVTVVPGCPYRPVNPAINT